MALLRLWSAVLYWINPQLVFKKLYKVIINGPVNFVLWFTKLLSEFLLLPNLFTGMLILCQMDYCTH